MCIFTRSVISYLFAVDCVYYICVVCCVFFRELRLYESARERETSLDVPCVCERCVL